MKALIIAAGRGSRLAPLGDCKPLIEVEGVPLIERVMLLAQKASIREFQVVTGFNGQKIRQHLSDFARDRSLPVEFIENAQWKRPNGLSVLAAESRLKQPFVLLMADHLFDPIIVRDLIESGVRQDQVKLAVDRRIDNNPLVDIEDVTRVKLVNGNIVDIGKGIPDYQGFDTGIFLCSPAIFPYLRQSAGDGDESLSGGIRRMAREHLALAHDIGNRFWLDIDDRGAFLKAVSLLREQRSMNQVQTEHVR